MKKRRIVILLTMVILIFFITISIGIVLRQKKANNIITFGNLKLRILQTTLDENNQEITIENNSKFNITNTSTSSRIIKIENLGKHDFFVRVSLELKCIDNNKYNDKLKDLISFNINTDDWIYNDGWYYYKKIVQKEETTSHLCTNIYFKTNEITNLFQNSAFTFNVKAEAIQAENNVSNVLDIYGWPSE